MILGVDSYHWWGPLGWLAKNTPGNIAASVIWAGPPFMAGVVVGKRRLAKADAHNRWVAQHVAEVNAAVTGTPAAPHPHLGQL